MTMMTMMTIIVMVMVPIYLAPYSHVYSIANFFADPEHGSPPILLLAIA